MKEWIYNDVSIHDLKQKANVNKQYALLGKQFRLSKTTEEVHQPFPQTSEGLNTLNTWFFR